MRKLIMLNSYMYMFISISLSIYIYIYIYTYMCVCACVCVCVCVCLFWVAKNVTSLIPKNHIFKHNGSKNNSRILKVSQKLTFVVFCPMWLVPMVSYFTLCDWFMSRSRVMNPFSSVHFNDLEHKGIFRKL